MWEDKDKGCIINKIQLIDFHRVSTRLELFYVLILRNNVHCTFTSTFFA